MPMISDLKSQTLSNKESIAFTSNSKISTEPNDLTKNMTLQERLNISNYLTRIG